MLQLYGVIDGNIQLCERSRIDTDAGCLIWCDLFEPTHEEEQWIERLLGIDVPTRDEMLGIELSNRLYQEAGALFATTSIVTRTNTPEPELHAVSFVLKDQTLITVRYSDPYSFRAYSTRLLAEPDAAKRQGPELMVGLVETMADRLADILESIAHTLDESNRILFRPAIAARAARQQALPDFEELLRLIGIQGDLLSKSRESLLGMTRVASYSASSRYFEGQAALQARLQTVLKDIAALGEHAGFLSTKLNFLLDATLGLVGIQQTAIIKIFSVAAVVFLPPTLVASIYGMNFAVMPELQWGLGYPMAVGLMILSAWLPYRFFKRKKWL